jgi:hypothetical protein
VSRLREITTRDGVTVKLGEQVWRVRSYGYPTRTRLTSHNIGWTTERYFADSRIAHEVALADAKADLKKAQQQARTAKVRIKRLQGGTKRT